MYNPINSNGIPGLLNFFKLSFTLVEIKKLMTENPIKNGSNFGINGIKKAIKQTE